MKRLIMEEDSTGFGTAPIRIFANASFARCGLKMMQIGRSARKYNHNIENITTIIHQARYFAERVLLRHAMKEYNSGDTICYEIVGQATGININSPKEIVNVLREYESALKSHPTNLEDLSKLDGFLESVARQAGAYDPKIREEQYALAA